MLVIFDSLDATFQIREFLGKDSVIVRFISAGVYSIRFASFRGSSTPFWSLPLSKPSAESAWTVTLPARSARLPKAFHAEYN